MVKSLGFFPGQAFCLESVLNISCSKIYAQCHFVVIILCKRQGDMSARLFDFHHQFYFVMHIGREIRDEERVVISEQGCIWFDKDDRLFGDFVVQLFDVFGIVSTNTDDFHRAMGNEVNGCLLVFHEGAFSLRAQ